MPRPVRSRFSPQFDVLADAYHQALLETVNRKRRDTARVLALLEYLPFGVLIVDGDRRVHAVNRQGRLALSRTRVLTIERGRIEWAPRADGAIAPLLSASTENRLPLRAARMALASRRSMWLVSWHLSTTGMFGPRSLFVILMSDGRGREPSEAVLRGCFGLTPAESRVAALLAAGRDTSGVARALSISRDGVRFHLKNVMTKIAVGRQAELIRVLLASPAGLVEP